VFEEADIRDAIACWETVRYISGVPVPGGGGLINSETEKQALLFSSKACFSV
jgi:hypothetical protein